ncbi:MAG: lysylphosphatidylglycerol synthase transmembrane domain-containing protein [Actinomycetota bacterium]
MVRLLALGLIAALGTLASATNLGAEFDLVRLVDAIPSPLLALITAVGGFGVLGVPLAYALRQLVRGRSRLLLEAVLTGLLAIAACWALIELLYLIDSSALDDALEFPRPTGSTRPLDDYLTALVAFGTVSRVGGEQLWRRLFSLAVGVYVLSEFTTGHATALSLLASVTLGAAVGVAVRYIAGSVNVEPDGAALAAALHARGVELVRLERRRSGHDQRDYLATTSDGTRLLLAVFDRDRIASGALYRVYRAIRVNAEVARGPVLSLERGAERRALLAMSAAANDVPVPRLVAGVPCGPDTIVLAYQHLDGTPLAQLTEPPSEARLAEVWTSVSRLHQARVTYRGLTPRRLLAGADGQILLPIPEDGAAFASDLRIAVDRAQLLVTTAQLAGASTAVRIARSVIGDAALNATAPVLQPVALDRETRAAMKKNGALIEQIRTEIVGQTSLEPPELSNLERVRPRTVITLVAAIVAGYLLIGQLGTVDLGTVLSGLRWRWLPVILLCSAATYLGAALALTGYVRERLSFARTVLTQVAAAFTGFVTPPAVGGVAVNIRYLQRAGLSTAAAATSVGTCQAVNAIMHIVLLVAVAAASGSSSDHALPIPGWAFVALAGAMLVAFSLLGVPFVRRWAADHLLPPIREAGPRLIGLFSDPVKLAQGLLGTLLLNGAYVAALWSATLAFGESVSFLSVAVVYLAGGAIGSLAPTPGGLGAVEAALSTGLTAVGMPGATAISAVLLFRLATFWIPVPFGWAALHLLQRRQAV